jgi:phosphopantothenoylcysteine decarboxylase / phosphopantothenate---cysteine ligase
MLTLGESIRKRQLLSLRNKNNMQQFKVVLGVTGSIAAYKAADITARLKENGVDVFCVMTKEAAEFITPVTLKAISGNKVYSKMFGSEEEWISHIALAKTANLLLIAPATANIIGKLANGIADDLLTCIALATRAPILIAPAMNTLMYESKPVQENIAKLKKFGIKLIGPEVGHLACGTVGLGHIASVEDTVSESLKLLGMGKPKALSSKHK